MDTKGFTDQVDNYIQNLRSAIYQPIVERDAGHAPIDRQKAFLLLLPMLNGESWTDEMHQASLAIGAIHTAFDIHDQIDSTDASSKEQQLMVLAGDHFSGIHYKLLASIPNFHLIRSLSVAIGRINECKTTLLQEPPNSIEDRLQLIGEVESACIIEFYHTFGFTRYISIVEVLFPLIWLIESGQQDLNRMKFPHLAPNARDTEKWIQQLQENLDDRLHNNFYLHKSLVDQVLKMAKQGASKLI
ncbi:heptaprenyl diphosphate synthase component 1 [Sporosarcina newyorkensis 2681]|uniref:Heptaprenyl diphosphate synthase component 1 n=1 Tax=Sporosarcina newyorkensis 2681 TaxID=1027292 RepID=F9DNS9_9BACL|nr:heptaprenyl diphosphate synthase component 1 [Sporosarcina newyorkensis]EGQ27572.1 heptaprenyl diphosphate synthase component 1 [Sporosarcina newyorkensis 2681]